jgi:phospholipid-transporting ATPase
MSCNTELGYSAAPIKRTAVERQVNIHIIFLFVFLLALSIGSTIGASINTVCLLYLLHQRLGLTDILQWFLSGQQWYLVEPSTFTGKGEYLLPRSLL